MDVVFHSGNIALNSVSYLIMDNDSGYVSNNLDQESNSDSVPETLNNSSVEILKSLLPKSIYISEDALLERPDIDHTINISSGVENSQDFPDLPYDELSNIVSSNAKTADGHSFLPTFNCNQSDSGSSAQSLVISIAQPIYYDLNTNVNHQGILNEYENISSNPSDGPFFGYENVPMEATNQVSLSSTDIFNKYFPHDGKVNLFSKFFANKQSPATCDAEEPTKSYVPIGQTTPIKEGGATFLGEKITSSVTEKLNANIVQVSNTPSEKSCSDIGTSYKRDENLFFNIEELPILIEGYPDLIQVRMEMVDEPPILVKEDSMSSIISRNEKKQVTPPKKDNLPSNEQIEETLVIPNITVSPESIEIVKLCDHPDEQKIRIDGLGDESTEVHRPSTNDRLTEAEKNILNNVTNTNVCFNNEPSTSKSSNFSRRSSVKNKENLTKTDVFKTPSKSRKRKLSEIGSPDLFSDDESSNPRPAVSPKIVEERFIHKLDQRLIHRVQGTIRGVPPPPDFTITNLTVHDILEKLEANKSYFWTEENMKDVKDHNAEKEKTSLNGSHNSSLGCSGSILIEGQHEEAISKEFPEILHSRHHGLHYNRSKLSEEIEHLCDKYASRYIGAETQATCNALDTQYMSPNRRRAAKPKWAVKSPGRRLSHLARRRITFPNGSLQASSSFASASRARQILIDCKKLELLNRKKSPVKMPKKTPLKSPTESPSTGRTPSSSAKKKLRMRFRLLSGDLNEMGQRSGPSSSKRALFQSPDKESRFRNILASSSSSINPSFNGDLNSAKRSLFPSPNKVKSRTSLFPSPSKKSPFKNQQPFEKKRKRDDDDENISNQAKFFRSQSTSGVSDRESMKSESLLTRTKSENVLMQSQNMTDWSAAHKKKLHWAVYESLKLQNISVTHPEFKVFASVLARVIRRCLFASGVKLEGSGTSEKMFRIAKRHSYAVVKGKSIEEIMSEYNKNKPRTAKPQGYIAPQDYNLFQNKESSSGRELAFRDRDRNSGDSIYKSSSSQSTVVKPESRIDRIRKVINFEDNR